jgi:hypothetical protein
MTKAVELTDEGLTPDQARMLSRWRIGMHSEPRLPGSGSLATKASLRHRELITPASLWRQRITPKGLDMLSAYERKMGEVPAT